MLDARWFKRFESVSFEDYEKLSGNKETRDEEKESFMKGEVENPSLGYPELERFDISGRENELLLLKEDILELEQNETVKKIYRTKINELLATLRMLQATKNGDDKKFSRYADFIYGKPEVDDVNYIVGTVKELVEDNIESHNEERCDAAYRLQNLFNNILIETDHGVNRDILPEGELINGKVESVEEAVEVFEEALREIGADDWIVEVDSEKGLSNFSVSQEHKIVRIPAEEKLMERGVTKIKLKGLIEHEIKTHVARRHNGEQSKLQLLGLGLDRYLKAEEGIATYAEQQITGAKDFAGIPRFLSIALAKGLTGEKLDFRKTYEIMTDYRLLSSSRKDVTHQQVAGLAYNDCVRIFRGTTCSAPGAVYPKDMSYFGNRAIWTLVSKDSDVVQSFSVGKYDPNNSEHIALLTQLGILDEDLEQLNKE